jgi:hypothetical protein
MEAMLGISLCSYLYLKLAKMLCLSYYLFNKIGEEGRFCLEARGWWRKGEEPGGRRERCPKQCIHI